MQKSPVSKPLGTSFLHCDPTGRKKAHVMLLFQHETRISAAAAETAAIVVVVTVSEATVAVLVVVAVGAVVAMLFLHHFKKPGPRALRGQEAAKAPGAWS